MFNLKNGQNPFIKHKQMSMQSLNEYKRTSSFMALLKVIFLSKMNILAHVFTVGSKEN